MSETEGAQFDTQGEEFVRWFTSAAGKSAFWAMERLDRQEVMCEAFNSGFEAAMAYLSPASSIVGVSE